MSWVRIWIHVVFSTKNRTPFLQTKEIRNKLFQHIRQNAREKGIWLDCINGYKDHAHCLLTLGKDQQLSKVVQLIKGESSYWINKNELISHKFMWQDDYWAVGVSETHLQAVRNYIYNQENHHKSMNFKEEVSEFMRKYDWEFK
ncbi:IS200/IS605 family transposase [Salegentibacter sp. JZCK2]|uniref:IS200/IS605 family transposase n=1 Tax=Salegentibacter tibetensis TaxID=2873600 RepID=UPI001CCB9C35|nr:IS200/IS605 family transposase [Salegentibacter tibetensis]MBZ9729676.1 IS200/IS605 family transposase [Salegentibacter tibetensis]